MRKAQLMFLGVVIFIGMISTASLASAMFAPDDKVTITGILMDKSCAVDMKMDAKGHDKDCNQMADCAKSGYGVVTDDGKYVAFDAKGNKDAAAWLKATKQKTNLKVTVTGTMEKSVLKVDTLK
jgi:hypothetical protein